MAADPQPRLWGPWEAVFHPSGSCMVLLASRDPALPHLYVFADPMPDDPQRGQRNRRVMCRVLADYMSGRWDRPVWLEDFEPRGDSAAEALTGAMIVATGPWLLSRRRPGEYRLDKRPEASRARRTLIACLLGRTTDDWPAAGSDQVGPGNAS